MGGVWERQIRSVRNVLSVLLENNGNQLDDESLSTFMCEAEAIINSRPLTVDGLADPDPLALRKKWKKRKRKKNNCIHTKPVCLISEKIQRQWKTCPSH